MKDNPPETDYQLLAEQLYAAGYEPIPLIPGTKRPLNTGWPEMQLPINPWPARHGIGLRTGKLVGIDIDVSSSEIVAALLQQLRADHEIITRTGKAPKVLIPVTCPEVTSKIISRRYVDTSRVIHCIEVLSHGQQFVAYAEHPETKQPYQWDGDLLTHTLPRIILEEILELFDLFDEWAEHQGWQKIAKKEGDRTKKKNRTTTDPLSTRPGDLFNACCPIEELLRHYGWQYCSEDRWTRPGKNPADGPSGTVFDNGVYIFSTSIPQLEANRFYDAFSLFAHYSHGGDFSKAAQEIAKESR